jgi:predicted nucleic acid-binding protein
MIVLLDNTVLSNFALIRQADLLKQLFGDLATTTSQVMVEFELGIQLRRLPTTNWSWLPILTLSATEYQIYQQFLNQLGQGEASCLAAAIQRQGIVYTDDSRARTIAKQLQLPVSGTLGVLARLVKRQSLTLVEADAFLHQMITFGYHSPTETLRRFI